MWLSSDQSEVTTPSPKKRILNFLLKRLLYNSVVVETPHVRYQDQEVQDRGRDPMVFEGEINTLFR